MAAEPIGERTCREAERRLLHRVRATLHGGKGNSAGTLQVHAVDVRPRGVSMVGGSICPTWPPVDGCALEPLLRRVESAPFGIRRRSLRARGHQLPGQTDRPLGTLDPPAARQPSRLLSLSAAPCVVRCSFPNRPTPIHRALTSLPVLTSSRLLSMLACTVHLSRSVACCPCSRDLLELSSRLVGSPVVSW